MDITDLAFFGGRPHARPEEMKFTWPRITDRSRAAVLAQLDDTVSIYDRSSVFARFEDAFAKYHERTFGLLFNSGTSAIQAMFDAIGLMPGDEVLCPVYTFHAAVSPMMSLGAIPVFCDTDMSGSISLSEIEARRTNRTRAVMVTHMWGVPVPEIGEIARFCARHSLKLLEDCSHAHGAAVDGRKVGTFGDAAAWSLQGQKIITGGEGGILLTDDQDIYSRALLFGHYNKRPLQELPQGSHLRAYALTGKGLKLRAHPLAIALALEQFALLPTFLANKRRFAAMFDDEFLSYPFISRAKRSGCSNSWYTYGFCYDSSLAGDLTRREFVALLHAEGLVEFDIPGSTKLLSDLPLFLTPNVLYPALYGQPMERQEGFSNAERFYASFVKIPVWAYDDDVDVVGRYVSGFRKVARIVATTDHLADAMRAA